MTKNKMNKGIYYALLTAGISGFSIFFSKIFVSKMDPVVFTTLKNIFVAIVLSSFLFRPKITEQIKKLTKNDWIKLISIGIIGGSIPFALFFTGLSMTSAVTGALIHKTLFIWVAFLAIIFLREKLSFIQMVGYVLVLWGGMWVSGFNGIHFSRGELMILGATILWAIENVIAKKTLTTIPSEIVGWSRMAIGSIVLIGIVVWQGNINQIFTLSLSNFYAVIIGATFLTGYVLSWYKALSKAPATVVSSVLSLSTIITGLLSTKFLSTKLTFPDITSFALIAAGVFLISWLWYKRSTLSS
jgi:drug/metabolite transporter (DMT)-like permease